MTDYSQMSDFQINAAVFEALHGGSPDFKEGENGAMVLLSFEGDIVDGNVVEVEIERGVFNPCNDISDGWPIVIESEIGLMKDKGDGSWDAFGKFKLFDGDWQFESDPVHQHSDRNPLRAAMVVFLKMKDAENVEHF
ncbi:phage protein NinX family protein [Cedecea sp. NFIX57]|uniref:phage protein NinX family protein n=1 Tax=Cedecea sp. NFIX57 TaxID=1566286 RepID=UPI000A0A1EB8|nr:phage protein NinX family protein [Cedecea sp. NFIX57]SMG61739.1 Protein of unknown function [Cedecea sp. NFIX57]